MKGIVIGMVKIWFVILKIQVIFLKKYNLKGFYHLVLLHIISLLSVLRHNLIIEIIERANFILLVMRNTFFHFSNDKG